MGRKAPNLNKPAVADTTVNSAAASGGFDPNAAGASYITSSIATAADPGRLEKKTEAQLNQELISMTQQERISYANRLKSAGYSVGNITGAVTKTLRKAWLDAHSDLTNEITAGQQLDLPTFLEVNKGAGKGGGSGVSIQAAQINETSAEALINKLFQDLTGYKATSKQIARYTKELQKAQAANPTRTAYTSGGNVTNSMTTGGIDTTQFLTSQIEETQPAVTKRATDAYTIMLDELGGLR